MLLSQTNANNIAILFFIFSSFSIKLLQKYISYDQNSHDLHIVFYNLSFSFPFMSRSIRIYIFIGEFDNIIEQ